MPLPETTQTYTELVDDTKVKMETWKTTVGVNSREMMQNSEPTELLITIDAVHKYSELSIGIFAKINKVFATMKVLRQRMSPETLATACNSISILVQNLDIMFNNPYNEDSFDSTNVALDKLINYIKAVVALENFNGTTN